MKKIMIAAALPALFLSGAAVAQPSRADANKDGDLTRAEFIASIDARFARLDTNRDGQVTPSERQAVREANRAERMQKHFAEMDANKDGNVTLAEMQAAHEKRGEMHGERGERHGKGGHFGGRHGGPGKHGMRGMGGDPNATISKADFQARALQWFDKFDADKNGVVTKAERQQAWAARKAGR